MCGRFTQRYTWAEIHAYLNLIGSAQNLEPRYNIAPTTIIDVALPADAGRQLIRMRWGLVPAWWKKSLKELPSTFNARAETVASKPMFRAAFRSRRCIIPASGFYEWRQGPDGKQPFYISAADGKPLAIAGLWDEWREPSAGDGDDILRSCTLIVTAANAFMAPIHNRMPCLLSPEQFDPWLAGAAGAEVLRAAPDSFLRAWPVSTRVNSVRNRDAALIEPLLT